MPSLSRLPAALAAAEGGAASDTDEPIAGSDTHFWDSCWLTNF